MVDCTLISYDTTNCTQSNSTSSTNSNNPILIIIIVPSSVVIILICTLVIIHFYRKSKNILILSSNKDISELNNQKENSTMIKFQKDKDKTVRSSNLNWEIQDLDKIKVQNIPNPRQAYSNITVKAYNSNIHINNNQNSNIINLINQQIESVKQPNSRITSHSVNVENLNDIKENIENSESSSSSSDSDANNECESIPKDNVELDPQVLEKLEKSMKSIDLKKKNTLSNPTSIKKRKINVFVPNDENGGKHEKLCSTEKKARKISRVDDEYYKDLRSRFNPHKISMKIKKDRKKNLEELSQKPVSLNQKESIMSEFSPKLEILRDKDE